MNERRIPTVVMVQPIKLDELEAKALAYVHEAGELRKAISPDATKCTAGFAPHGFVETPEGIYAMCSEGVGSSHVVTDEAPYVIEFYPETHRDEHSFSFSMFPACSMKLGPAALRELADGDQVNLADFIRTFGARLDGNYESWRHTLEKALAVKVTA